MAGFDVIGDIHGHADALTRLLGRLGYVERDGVFRHPDRRVVFIGDFIDRGPQQREVLRIGRAMVDKGAALAVMGNHEFNAIGFATPDDNSGFLRPRTEKNQKQHRVFLDQIGEGSKDHDAAVSWFRTLPLWLDLGGLHVVHACWNAAAQRTLAAWLDGENRLTEDGVVETHRRGSAAFAAAETLLKGPEARLPHGSSFHDKDGHLRYEARLRWWDPDATSFRNSALGMDGREAELPEDPVPAEFQYRDTTPVLFGHYWMEGTPRILHPHASCLDFSIAKNGFLAAYRWSGEPQLRDKNLECVSDKAVPAWALVDRDDLPPNSFASSRRR